MAEAIQQLRQNPIRTRRGAHRQGALPFRAHRVGRQGVQGEMLKAQFRRQAGERLGEKPRQMASVAVWRAGADHKALFRAIHAKSGQRKPPRAKPGTGKPRAKRCQQAVQQGGNSVGGQDRLRQGARHA